MNPLRDVVPTEPISMLHTLGSWIRIGNGANNADGAQGLEIGLKPLVMGSGPQCSPWLRACILLGDSSRVYYTVQQFRGASLNSSGTHWATIPGHHRCVLQDHCWQCVTLQMEFCFFLPASTVLMLSLHAVATLIKSVIICEDHWLIEGSNGYATAWPPD